MTIVLSVLASASVARADRAFTPRFSLNTAGDLTLAANTLMTCPAADAKCGPAQRGANASNNSFAMGYVDVDGDPATFDSSSAGLTLPANATVVFAGLYWGANTSAGDKGAAARDPAARGRVQFSVPGGAPQPVTATTLDTGSARSQREAYQGFADVTAQVAAAGPGNYTVANVQAGTGLDRYAGWSLVVAYQLAGAPPRNLTVFDGFVTINDGDPPREVPISGFTTPKRGSVDSRVGFVAYEGDRGGTGDSLALGGKPLSDAISPANNFFNSGISINGVVLRPKQPDYDNNLGYDASIIDAPGALPNGATSTTIRAQTTGDTYLPGVLFLSTQVFSPDLSAAKSVTDVNGGTVQPGDVLEYTISGTNRGQDSATDLVVSDPAPANTTVVPGSLDAGGGSAVYDDAGKQVVFRIGNVAPGAAYRVRFRVTVDPGTTGPIADTARLDYLADTLGFPLQGETNETRAQVVAPDLKIEKLHSGSLAPGTNATYFFSVSNVGSDATSGTVTVTDPFPAGVTPTGAGGPGWTCDPPGPTGIRCTRSDPLAPGASYPDITATATVSLSATGPLANTASVNVPGDLDPSNNSATNSGVSSPITNLTVAKRVVPDVVAPGARVTYTLDVRNDGPFNSTGVTLNDPLPAGLTLVSATPSQGTCSGTLTCNLGPLQVFTSASVTVVADVAAGLSGRDLDNTATVTGAQPDPPGDPTPNTATATVGVRSTVDVDVEERQVGPATAGAPLAFEITATNRGPGTATNARIDDLLPPVLNNPTAAVTTGGGSCSVGGRLATCVLDPIPPGATAKVTVTGTLPSGAGGARLLNGALFTSGAFSPSPTPGPQSPPAGAIAGPAADLGVAKLVTTDPITAGGVATYQLRASNHGPSKATGAVVRDTLPEGVVALKLPKGCKQQGKRVIRCVVGDLGVEASVSRALSVRVPSTLAGRSLTNTATIDGTLADPVSANDSASAVARAGPRLTLSKKASAGRVRPGGSVSYILSLRNAGPGTAIKVNLCDAPGKGLRITSAPGARRVKGRTCWSFASLRAGRRVRRTLSLRTSTAATGRVRNRATARGVGSSVDASASIRVVRAPVPPPFTG